MGLLRIITAGSVDDGKSTLIGRLLYDTKQLLADQMSALESASKKKGAEQLDFSLLTDGLKEEREQGITIDVAYRYMVTARNKYILADTPGHIQYTRNFVTACSNSDLALLIIDATKGLLEQTRRHVYIMSMMELNKVVFCVNKMDAIGYNEKVFSSICNDIQTLLSGTSVSDVMFIPISALHGDNIVTRSKNMGWYTGIPLLEYLDGTDIREEPEGTAIMPVQAVVRTGTGTQNDRAYAGRITSGVFHKDDAVVILPAGLTAVITAINNCGNDVSFAKKGESVSVSLSQEIDIARGDIIACKNNDLKKSSELSVLACWLDKEPMQERKKYIVRHTTSEIKGMISEVLYKINIHDFSKIETDTSVTMNDIACFKLKLSGELVFNSYSADKKMGALILVDPATNNTVAACTII